MRSQLGRGEVALLVSLVIGTVVLIVLVGIALWGYPKYKVYAQEMSGRAVLVEAESSRQVAVLEANAKRDAAKALAQAEIERARGVAEANRIIGASLDDNEEYLRYLFVNGLEQTRNQVIYVPTEANLPILEANRLPVVPQP